MKIQREKEMRDREARANVSLCRAVCIGMLLLNLVPSKCLAITALILTVFLA